MLIPILPTPPNIKILTTCRNDNIEDIEDINSLFNHGKLYPINQVHGNICIQLPAYPEPKLNIDVINADACFTIKKNTVCLIKTADCLPILVCNKAGTWVAAIHAGWRGIASGVIQNTINNYTSNNSNNDLLIWLGPAISQKHYIVGDDVRDIFITQNLQNQQEFIPAPHDEEKNLNKWHLNLYGLAKIILCNLGVVKANIYGGEYCTYSNPHLFYSYRRNTGEIRRQFSGIYIS